ncbi:MAG: hypothetical protein EOP47_17255 [Sphingobacteriaceae bacterium]|nr:MAG: hypothetical protein EOP47_17255 [Sphingobacteriaceae bacterium]
MKKALIAIGLLFTLFNLETAAQNMRALNNMLNRQHINGQMDINRRMLNNRDPIYNTNTQYFVVMNDMSVIEVKSRILTDEVTHKKYLLYINKKLSKSDPNREQKIYPEQTIKIACVDLKDTYRTNRGKFLDGMPNDSCWLFKVISGTINGYSYYCDRDDIFPPSLVAIQKFDDKVVPLTTAALTDITGEDAELQKKIIKGLFPDAIKLYNKKNPLKEKASQ